MTSRLANFWQLACARPRLASLLLGAISAVGFPPLQLWPIGLAALAAIIALLGRAENWRLAAQIGWLFGFAHLTVANNWIATAFTYQAEMPVVLGWFAVPLLCTYLAVYPALAALIAHLVGRKAPPLIFSAIFAAAWIVTEWLRSWVFTGYPWPPLGLMLLGDFDSPGVALLLPWIGTYALSGLAILIAGAFTLSGGPGLRAAQGGLAALVVAAMALPFPHQDNQEGAIPFVLIQPLIPQEEREDVTKFEEQFQRTARLTMPGRDSARLVLWPEAAIPDYLEDGYPVRYYVQRTAAADPQFARKRIASLIGERSTLLTGLAHLNMGEREGRIRAVSARNAVSAINGDGEIFANYNKAHLVPYGEYLPMRELLEPIGLSRLVPGSIDYEPGPGPQTLELGRFGRAGIQICYEIVFSGQVVDRANRPQYIFNPSVDGWFGAWGPPQHLAQARMRAIEEGLPVLRSTTTGISAVIDANGIVLDSIPTGVSGRIDGAVPLAKSPTLFARLGNMLPIGWAIFLFGASLVALRVRRV
ncbi:MAG: apolipoprotein N-acyltransferase [Sphingomonadales bacterium]|nr:MAG: apolipoprotein N-acyltransferase [Sphingomonadales bacterium]